jgi:hypothetical protein
MNPDQTFASVLKIGWLILVPILVFHRVRSQTTRERLDRRQEGMFILLTLRPAGVAHMVGVIAYLANRDSPGGASAIHSRGRSSMYRDR